MPILQTLTFGSDSNLQYKLRWLGVMAPVAQSLADYDLGDLPAVLWIRTTWVWQTLYVSRAPLCDTCE